jgi:hypothetical protein
MTHRVVAQLARTTGTAPCSRCPGVVTVTAGAWHAAEADETHRAVCDHCTQRDDPHGHQAVLAWPTSSPTDPTEHDVSAARHGRPDADVRAPGLSNVPRLALDVSECCAALGCSWDFWQQHVAAEVPIVRRGRRKLVPVRALEAWLDENAHAVLDTGSTTLTAHKVPANRGVRASPAPARKEAA